MWKKVVVAAVALLALAAGGLWCWRGHETYCYKLRLAQQITGGNLDYIRSWDLNAAEAEALLGPPGDFTTRPGVRYRDFKWRADLSPAAPGDVTLCWLTDDARITIRFDKDGRQALNRPYPPMTTIFEWAEPDLPPRRTVWWKDLAGRLGF